MWHVQLVTACPGVGKDGADGSECEGEQYGAIDIHVYTYMCAHTQDIIIYNVYIWIYCIYLCIMNLCRI